MDCKSILVPLDLNQAIEVLPWKITLIWSTITSETIRRPRKQKTTEPHVSGTTDHIFHSSANISQHHQVFSIL
jgi:hypothetical protein